MPTIAKPGLKRARDVLLEHLDIRPGRVPADLDPDEVGIVGDPAHVGGYHCGRSRLFYRGKVLADYSATECARDARGLKAHPDWASGLDIGQFTITSGGRTHTLITFSLWLVDLCRRKDPDAADIREVIYSPDGRTVRRWDALGRRTGGDDSHRWHTHISEFRDADGSRMVRLAYRYLAHIGLIDGEDDDMKMTDVVYERTEPDGRKTKRTAQNIMGTLDVHSTRGEQDRVAEEKWRQQVDARMQRQDETLARLAEAMTRVEAAVGGGSAPIRPGQ